jgi:1,4-alpha-glucan branching enzyme
MSAHDTQSFDAVAWGEYDRAFEVLGAHRDAQCIRFSTWAPNAKTVSVVGPFNGWNETSNPLHQVSPSGVWSVVLELDANPTLQNQLQNGATYQFCIDGVLKADPYARAAQLRPNQASSQSLTS